MTITTTEKIKYLKNKFKDGKPPERKKSNKKINEGLDLMIKDIQKEKKKNKTLTEKLNKITQQDNAFDQSYSDSVHEYNYTILYSTSIIGMIAFMIYSGKLKYKQ